MPAEMVDYRPQLQEAPTMQQFSSEEIMQFAALQRQYRELGPEDQAEPLVPHTTYFERTPGYVDQRCQELLQLCRTSIKNKPYSVQDHEQSIKEIDELRILMYAKLPGARPQEGEKEDRAYDIVKDVWRLQKLLDQIGHLSRAEREEKINAFRKYLELQNETFLAEECHVYDRTTTYTFRNGKMYMDELSTTVPFEEIVALGVALAEHDGSVDLADEIDELKGVIQMGEFGFFGEGKYILYSLHGEVPETRYGRDYIDIGKTVVDPQTGERKLLVTRFKTASSYEACADVAVDLQKNFFAGFDPRTMSRRGWNLSHLVLTDMEEDVYEMYNRFFKIHPDAITRSEFIEHVYKAAYPYVKAYIDLLCADASWEDIAEGQISIYTKAVAHYKKFLKERVRTVIQEIPSSYGEYHEDDWRNHVVAADAGDRRFWGRQEVVTTGGSCGSIKGYGLSGDPVKAAYTSTLIESLSQDALIQSAMEFLEEDEDECDCPGGNQDNHYHCPKKEGGCGKRYEDETNKTRTAECSCGFKFGCGTGTARIKEEEQQLPEVTQEVEKENVIHESISDQEKKQEAREVFNWKVFAGRTLELAEIRKEEPGVN